MSMAPPQGDLTDALRAVHEAYIAKVNAAVEMDRSDLVAELTDAYFADAQHMITEPRRAVHPEPK
jgi:hypothetical protein